VARFEGETSNRVIEILQDWNEFLRATGIDIPELSL